MGRRKSKDSIPEPSSAVKSLFGDDNPFRRRPQTGPASGDRPAPELGLGLGVGPKSAARAAEEEKPVDGGADAAEGRKRKREDKVRSPNPTSAGDPIPTKRKRKVEADDDGESPKKKRRKRKRGEIEEEYEKRTYGAAAEEEEEGGGAVVAVGGKRKAADASKEMLVSKDSFDDESKLVRTVFVGNLPLKTKRKVLLKEFARFGEVESLRIRSVPLIDSKVPRKGAIIKGKINDAVDCVHAYIVFKEEQSAHAALSHNMAQFGGNHIRVDTACPPRKKMKGEGPLYDRKRTIFVGNLPFDVKDEELYQLFCGDKQLESGVEAVRVIRDPNTSLGKGIAYVLFKTRDTASSAVRKRDLKIRDRLLRLSYAKSADAVPSKRKAVEQKRDIPQKKLALMCSETHIGKPKVKAASLSYQGLRSSKTGVLKKSSVRPQSGNHGSHGTKRASVADEKVLKAKRPAVAARKAKQLLKKRKQETGTPANTHQNKKARRH